MGRVAMLTGSRGLRYATVIALVAALVGGVYVLSSTGNKRTIVGYFTSAVGLYPGDQVRVLGVPVGEIDMIEPRSPTSRSLCRCPRTSRCPWTCRP